MKLKKEIDIKHQYIERLIRIIFIVGISLVGICFLKENSEKYFWAETVVQSSENNIVYEPIKEDKCYTQKFRCWGNLNHLQIFFDNCEENAGQIVVSVLDSKGNYIIPETECDLNMNGTGSVWLPICFSNNLKLGHSYILKWYGKNISTDSVPFIQCEKSNIFGKNLAVDSNNSGKKMKITYVYDSMFLLKNCVILCVLFILIVISFKLRIRIPMHKYKIYKTAILLLNSVVNFFIVEYLNEGHITLWNTFTNVTILYIFGVFLCVLFSEKVVAVLICCICLIFGIANYYVTLYQGKPLTPWDLNGLSTAWNVAGSYKLEITFSILVVILVLILMFSVLFKIEVEKDLGFKQKERVIAGLKGCVCLVLFLFFALPKIPIEIYDILGSYRTQGALAGFVSSMQFLDYKKPKGYSEKICKDILENTKTVETKTSIQAKNIIVIMDESFADFRHFGDGEVLLQSYTPFIDSLQENVIRGNLYVPVYGGGTANTEFEFLTGVSCAYVPNIPYSTYINKDTNSICTSLAKDGFSNIAFHPGNAKSWNRDLVYPYLGFEEFFTLEDIQEMKNLEHSRIYVSDASDYEFLINDYEKRNAENYFMFNVTIQNHGGYEGEKEEFKSNADLSALGDFPYTENYLGLLKQSDAAFEKLVKYFENVSEPTVICFFGDHHPSVEAEFYEKLMENRNDVSAEELKKKYVTPFLIWANYDIEEEYIDKISSNYLSLLVRQAAGLSLDEYDSFLYQLYKKYPVVSVAGVWDNQNNFVGSVKDIDDEMLDEYEKLQYYRMSGK